jgi:hypothetical protein
MNHYFCFFCDAADDDVCSSRVLKKSPLSPDRRAAALVPPLVVGVPLLTVVMLPCSGYLCIRYDKVYCTKRI